MMRKRLLPKVLKVEKTLFIFGNNLDEWSYWLVFWLPCCIKIMQMLEMCFMSSLWLTLSFSAHVTTVGLLTTDIAAVLPLARGSQKNYDHLYSTSCSSTRISGKAQKFRQIGHKLLYIIRVRPICIFFNARAKLPYFYFQFEMWHHRHVLQP